jgi:hypothetical protein
LPRENDTICGINVSCELAQTNIRLRRCVAQRTLD